MFVLKQLRGVAENFEWLNQNSKVVGCMAKKTVIQNRLKHFAKLRGTVRVMCHFYSIKIIKQILISTDLRCRFGNFSDQMISLETETQIL